MIIKMFNWCQKSKKKIKKKSKKYIDILKKMSKIELNCRGVLYDY